MGDIKIEPENYEELKKKYQERQEEKLKRALERNEVNTIEELRDRGLKSVRERWDRQGENKPLKDRTVIVEPQSEDIQNQKERLLHEISTVAARRIPRERFGKEVEESAEVKEKHDEREKSDIDLG